MAFRLVKQARAWWPVTFAGVTEDGEVVENRIDLRFFVHDEDRFYELLGEGVKVAQASAAAETGEQAEEAGLKPTYSGIAADFVEKLADNWRGVEAENGDALKWEPEHVRQLVNVPNVFVAILAAYKACRAGREETRAGN